MQRKNRKTTMITTLNKCNNKVKTAIVVKIKGNYWKLALLHAHLCYCINTNNEKQHSISNKVHIRFHHFCCNCLHLHAKLFLFFSNSFIEPFHNFSTMQQFKTWRGVLVRWVSKYGPQEIESSLSLAWRNTVHVRKCPETCQTTCYLLVTCLHRIYRI